MRRIGIAESANDAAGLAMRRLREARGETQSDAAARLGWGRGRMSKLEQGGQQWTLIDIAEVCERYGLTLSAFVQLAEAELTSTTPLRTAGSDSAG